MDMFIDLHQLQKIRRNGPRYTWTRKQSDPIMVTLDKIQVFTEWEPNILYVLHGAELELDQINGQSFLILGRTREKDQNISILKNSGF
jgi:hypothetical protein